MLELTSITSTVLPSPGKTYRRAVGVQSEANLPFAGLHQLLRPIFARHHDLPALENSAMKAAFGTTRTPPPELYLIALATLELLSEVAARTPILLAAEDAHWLDRPTADVLAFVGRRLESDPVILIAAIREGYDSPLLAAGLPELRAERLPDRAARELLNARFPDLAPAVLDRLLDEAEGNPLALLELPAALGATIRGGEAPLPPRLPLTVRLERAFAARAAELPGTTCTLLRIAATDSGCDLAVIMRAAELTDGMQPAVKDLVPAMRAHLIEVDGTTALGRPVRRRGAEGTPRRRRDSRGPGGPAIAADPGLRRTDEAGSRRHQPADGCGPADGSGRAVPPGQWGVPGWCLRPGIVPAGVLGRPAA
jgi:hypothetical protein